jgi:predicted ribosome quality control (RQC) complex YloA/Tae2 family protein
MTEIIIDLRKTLEQNASDYFEKAKKAKHKIETIKKVIYMYKNKLEKLEKEQVQIQEEKTAKEKRTSKW